MWNSLGIVARLSGAFGLLLGLMCIMALIAAIGLRDSAFEARIAQDYLKLLNIASTMRWAQAEEAIAGFAVLNDVTCRDWQNRTREWLQGKTWERTTPLGPYLVTPEELPGGVRPTLDITTEVDGETMQKDNTRDLLFDPVALVEYVSTIVTLQPGDVIATGTPGGVGHARKPPIYLQPGQQLVTRIADLGSCQNRVLAEGLPS